MRYRILTIFTLVAGSVLGVASPAWGALTFTIGTPSSGQIPVPSPGPPGSPGSTTVHSPAPPPPIGTPIPVGKSCQGTNCSNQAVWVGLRPPAGWSCKATPFLIAVWNCSYTTIVQPPSPGAPSTSFDIGFGGTPATMSYSTWWIHYPSPQGVPMTYGPYSMTGDTNTSPPIEAYCDGAAVMGSVTYTLTPPTPSSYRNPPAGWSWVTPPPQPPPTQYNGGSFTTPPCSPYRQDTLTGVRLVPSPNPSKAPTATAGYSVVADGTFHTFYFQPEPVCPHGHPNCGVDTTVVWNGGEASMGGQDGAGGTYGPIYTGFGGSGIPRWQLYAGVWHYRTALASNNLNRVVSGSSTVALPTSFVNENTCGDASNAPSGSVFAEVCVSANLHSPSNGGHPYVLDVAGQFAAVYAHWYFAVTLNVSPVEQTSKLVIEKTIQVPVWGYCYIDLGHHNTRRVPCIRAYQPRTISRRVTWIQPQFGSSAYASGLQARNPHEVFFNVNTAAAPSQPALISGVATALSGSSTF